MSSASPKLERRERAIEAARRRLRRLEIETHRIKASLARLEADYEDDVADTLTRKLRRRVRAHRELGDDAEIRVRSDVFDDTSEFATSSLATEVGHQSSTAVLPFAPPPAERSKPVVRPKSRARVLEHAAHERTEPMPPFAVEMPLNGTGVAAPPGRKKAAGYRKAAAPMMASVGVHAVALVFCVSVSFVTLVQHRIPLFASPTESDDDIPAPLANVKIDPSKFDDAELLNTLSLDADFNISDNFSNVLDPAQLGAGHRPNGDIGQLDMLPSDIGSLMAGGGKPSSGKSGGDVGNAIFFGARSKGNRFVFVIDNSSSMKNGKLEVARAELVRSVESLTAKQSFYVIFVSDQTYPMFFPQPELDMIPATPANKKRLSDWLPKAILASGKNREMIKAMDMAASLRPQAVFLLWDGDMRYSDNVRLDVMAHLTRPNQWNFVIHTLGMGITSADAEQNLTAIAAAHGGLYRRVDVPAAQRN
jgi:hypothetical protein